MSANGFGRYKYKSDGTNPADYELGRLRVILVERQCRYPEAHPLVLAAKVAIAEEERRLAVLSIVIDDDDEL